jgi:hypothetical protein
MPLSLIESDNKQYLIYVGSNLKECWEALEKTKHLFLSLRGGEPIVVIDGSFEGELFQQKEHAEMSEINYEGFSKIHTLLGEYHTDLTVLVYGDANLEKNYDHWCKANKQERVFGKCVYRPHTLLQRSLEHYNLNPPKPNLSFKSRHFICLNGVARHHRVEMVNLLYEKDWHLKGHISWLRKGSHTNNGWLSVQSRPQFDHETLKLDFDSEELADESSNQLLCPPQYSDACFDIVNETLPSDDALFITDKTWKPILQKTPFIIHGSKNSHKHLEEYFGIKPYTDLFDYRFDTLDYNERFDSIKDDNLERLLNMDINELNEIVNSDKMQDLLEYNKKQLLTHFIDKPKDIRLLGLSESGIGKDLLSYELVKSLILLGY